MDLGTNPVDHPQLLLYDLHCIYVLWRTPLKSDGFMKHSRMGKIIYFFLYKMKRSVKRSFCFRHHVPNLSDSQDLDDDRI